jgi:uncharacterized protein (DUF4415 family)
MKHKDRTDWDQLDVMTDDDIAKGIIADPDAAPELDASDFARLRPASEVVPEIVESYRRSRGPQKGPTKVPVSIRLRPEVVDYFKAKGPGWQSRINEVLEEYVISQQ